MSKLEVAKVDRYGPAYTKESVINVIADEVNNPSGTHFSRGAKVMSNDLQLATKVVNDAHHMLATAIDKYHAQTAQVSAHAKRCSGDSGAVAHSPFLAWLKCLTPNLLVRRTTGAPQHIMDKCWRV